MKYVMILSITIFGCMQLMGASDGGKNAAGGEPAKVFFCINGEKKEIEEHAFVVFCTFKAAMRGVLSGDVILQSQVFVPWPQAVGQSVFSVNPDNSNFVRILQGFRFGSLVSLEAIPKVITAGGRYGSYNLKHTIADRAKVLVAKEDHHGSVFLSLGKQSNS